MGKKTDLMLAQILDIGVPDQDFQRLFKPLLYRNRKRPDICELMNDKRSTKKKSMEESQRMRDAAAKALARAKQELDAANQNYQLAEAVFRKFDGQCQKKGK